ncbi:AmmeMemoRadiSam system protein B [Candidatus Poribacteria bacterium]|nr:AmmeMemoRadiSam system protein B [Candidatus Poribacteria bacterium]
MKRKSIVSGSFYPSSKNDCLKLIETFNEKFNKPSRSDIIAGIVPHAGWIFSGQIAFDVIASFKASNPTTFIMLGAVHVPDVNMPAIYIEGSWETPLGEIEVDAVLAGEILSNAKKIIEDNFSAHTREHSIEVQVPFIQHLFPQSKIVPIMIPPNEQAVKIGYILHKIIAKENNKKIIVIGTSDLTHYGWNYGFAPFGIGKTGHDWVTKDNDKRIIDLILKLEPEKIVKEASGNFNACGSGAIAATTAFAKVYGKKNGELLKYTTSSDIMPEYGDSSFVGYSGIIF